MSTANLPPERRAEIARNAAKARKNWGRQGRKPSCVCGACQRCRRRAIEKKYRANKKAAKA